MANVSIKLPTTPDFWIPSGNPILFGFKTTNTNIKLSYLIDVIINGNYVCRLKYAVYDRNNMTLDFNKIVNDYISSTFSNDTQAFVTVQNEVLKLEIKVTEEYSYFVGSVENWVVDTANAVTSKAVYIWYSAADFQKSRILWNYYTYNDLIGNTYDKYGRFLGVQNACADVARNTLLGLFPNPPVGKQILFNNLYKIGFSTRRSMSFFTTSTMTGGSKHTMILQCWCYNEKYEMTKRFAKKIHSGSFVTANWQDKIGVVPVGASDLNNLSWDNTELDAGSISAIDVSEDKYYFITVCGMDEFGNLFPQVSVNMQEGNKWVGFELVPCNPYKVFNILYQTTEGGWWQIRADRKHQNETKVDTTIKYNPWKYQPMTTLPNEATFKQVMHTDADGTITLNTNWIENQGIVREIEDMIISPQIYLVEDMELGAKFPVYTPVILKDSTYQIYDKGQDKLFRYEFEFEEGYKKNTLR